MIEQLRFKKTALGTILDMRLLKAETAISL